jgi:hypothetical protein
MGTDLQMAQTRSINRVEPMAIDPEIVQATIVSGSVVSTQQAPIVGQQPLECVGEDPEPEIVPAPIVLDAPGSLVSTQQAPIVGQQPLECGDEDPENCPQPSVEALVDHENQDLKEAPLRQRVEEPMAMSPEIVEPNECVAIVSQSQLHAARLGVGVDSGFAPSPPSCRRQTLRMTRDLDKLHQSKENVISECTATG